MGYRDNIFYLMVVGLAITSSLYERSMKSNVLRMDASAKRAKSLQVQSDTDKTLSMKDEEQAAADAIIGNELEKKAEFSEARSEQIKMQAAADEGTAEKFALQAAEEESEANADESRSNEENAEASQHEKLAGQEATQAETYQAKAAKEKDESIVHATKADEDKAVVEKYKQEGTTAAEAASSAEALAVADAAAIATCQAVPLLNFACDILGGASEIGLQATAVREAAKSARAFAAAADAKKDEDAELAAAAELDADATADAAAAAQLRDKAQSDASEAVEWKTKAQADFAVAEEARAEADEDSKLAAEYEAIAVKEKEEAEAKREEATEEEAVANKKFALSDKEKEQAAVEKARSQTEMADAERYKNESLRRGLAAFWDATFVVVLSLFILSFFVARFIVQSIIEGKLILLAIPPSMSLTRSQARTSPVVATIRSLWKMIPMEKISGSLIHVVVFIAAMSTFAEKWLIFDTLATRSRGGVIIITACVAGAAQAFTMHAMNYLLALVKSRATGPCRRYFYESVDEVSVNMRLIVGVVSVIIYASLAAFIFLMPLCVMEALILLVNFGQQGAVYVATLMHGWIAWVLFLFGAAVHMWFFGNRVTPSKETEMKKCDDSRIGSLQSVDELLEKEESGNMPGGEMFVGKTESPNEASLLLIYSEDTSRSGSGSNETVELDENVKLSEKASAEDDLLTSCSERGSNDRVQIVEMTTPQYLHRLRIPFEVLMISCMVALIRSCLPTWHHLRSLFAQKVGLANSVCAIAGICLLGLACTTLMIRYVTFVSRRRTIRPSSLLL